MRASLGLWVLVAGMATTWGSNAFADSSRSARLLRGAELDSSLRPSLAPPLRITDDLRFIRGHLPALDRGGALDDGSRQALSMTLGFLVGFGVGHLVARDVNGFALFVIVDTALVMGSIVVGALLGGPFAAIGIAALVVSHGVQGIDAYRYAGGAPLDDRALLPTARTMGWAF